MCTLKVYTKRVLYFDIQKMKKMDKTLRAAEAEAEAEAEVEIEAEPDSKRPKAALAKTAFVPSSLPPPVPADCVLTGSPTGPDGDRVIGAEGACPDSTSDFSHLEVLDPLLAERMRRYGFTEAANDAAGTFVLSYGNEGSTVSVAVKDWDFPLIMNRLQSIKEELRSLDHNGIRQGLSELKDIWDEVDFRRARDFCSHYEDFIDEITREIIPHIIPLLGFVEQKV
jgi:hypothetical protein